MSTASLIETTTGTAKRQFCTFWVAGRLYGVDILDVKEINSEVAFTPVFHSPEEVKGYVNIRGHIHLIIDLRFLLGFAGADHCDASRIVLFKSSVGESFGVFVDRVGDVVDVDEDKIEDRCVRDPSQQEETECQAKTRDLTAGVCKLDGELLVILDARRFLNAVKVQR